jgi:hypothetical protein
VRSGDRKLVEWFEDGRTALYDLRRDPSEVCDRSGQEPEQARRLHQALRRWCAEVAARMPQPNPDYDDMLAGRKPCPDGNGRITPSFPPR